MSAIVDNDESPIGNGMDVKGASADFDHGYSCWDPLANILENTPQHVKLELREIAWTEAFVLGCIRSKESRFEDLAQRISTLELLRGESRSAHVKPRG